MPRANMRSALCANTMEFPVACRSKREAKPRKLPYKIRDRFHSTLTPEISATMHAVQRNTLELIRVHSAQIVLFSEPTASTNKSTGICSFSTETFSMMRKDVLKSSNGFEFTVMVSTHWGILFDYIFQGCSKYLKFCNNSYAEKFTSYYPRNDPFAWNILLIL